MVFSRVWGSAHAQESPISVWDWRDLGRSQGSFKKSLAMGPPYMPLPRVSSTLSASSFAPEYLLPDPKNENLITTI